MVINYLHVSRIDASINSALNVSFYILQWFFFYYHHYMRVKYMKNVSMANDRSICDPSPRHESEVALANYQ